VIVVPSSLKSLVTSIAPQQPSVRLFAQIDHRL
jgi:hypothetical protein